MDILEIIAKLFLTGVAAFLLGKAFTLLHWIFIAPFIRRKCLKNHTYHEVSGDTIIKGANAGEDGKYNYKFVFCKNRKKYTIRFQTDDVCYSPTKAYYRKNPHEAVLTPKQLGGFEYYWLLCFITWAVFFSLSLIFF